MTARPPEVIDGLAVRKGNSGWTVVHEASGLYVSSGLRLRRFAEQARTEFLALGVDFTGTREEVLSKAESWRVVIAKWRQRALQTHLDLDTLEYYGHFVHYGQVVPSARLAAELRRVRAVVAAELETGEPVRSGSESRRLAVLRAYEAAGKAVYAPGEGWTLVREDAEAKA
jgi:hypothetical protein